MGACLDPSTSGLHGKDPITDDTQNRRAQGSTTITMTPQTVMKIYTPSSDHHQLPSPNLVFTLHKYQTAEMCI